MKTHEISFNSRAELAPNVFDPNRALTLRQNSMFARNVNVRRQVYVWRVGERSPPRALTGHTKHVHGLTFLPDGKTLVSGSEDGSIRFNFQFVVTMRPRSPLPFGLH